MDGSPLSPAERRGVTIDDRALLIYTSGTTGLPKGRQRQPPAHPELGRLVRRTDRCFARRPAVRLPAGLSQRRRHRRALQHAARRGVGSAGRQILGESFLARCRALGLHAVPVYRRALPLSSEGPVLRIRNQAPASAGLRQWSARRCLGSVSGAFCHSANTGILRRDRRQFLAVQRRGQARRDRPDSAAVGASLSGGDHSSRRRTWRASQDRRRPLHSLHQRRNRRSHWPDRECR